MNIYLKKYPDGVLFNYSRSTTKGLFYPLTYLQTTWINNGIICK